MRATFFVTTGWIGTPDAPWWDQIAGRVRQWREPNLPLPGWFERPLPTADDDQKTAAIRSIQKLAKEVEDCRRLELLDALRARCGEWHAAGRVMMSWDEVRRLSAAGMEIGSHTVSHPLLPRVAEPAVVQRELVASREQIERETGCPCVALSYPVGRAAGIDEALVTNVRAAGYRYACVYEHGVNPREGADRYRLRRIKAEVGDDFTRFRAKALFPGWVRH
jgi:peptidoglycan/xylan/chitin deacetylase (PgdA/CDA1 family)